MRGVRRFGLCHLGLVLSGCAAQETRVVTVTRETALVVGETTPRATSRATVTLQPPTPPGMEPAAMVRALEGHGRWVESLRYGAVWVPEVGTGWMPYASAGRWVSTRDGWSWQGDEAWGQVAFHYGRWTTEQGRWAWVPGERYAPAWVEWRAGNGWIGWAPLAPPGDGFRAPFVYCNVDRLEGSGLWSRLVQGPAAVSLFAATTALDPAAGSRLAEPPEAFAAVADSLVGTRRVTRTLGFTSGFAARSYVPEAPRPAPRVAGYAPVHMPPPTDAVPTGIAARFGYGGGGFGGAARAPVTAQAPAAAVGSFVYERGVGAAAPSGLPPAAPGAGMIGSSGSAAFTGGPPLGASAVPAASSVPAATFSQGVSTSPVAAW